MTQRKTDKNIEERLLSGRNITVISALDEIKTKGNIAYLPLMFDLLKSRPDIQVEKEILNILGTLKVQEAAPVIVKALQSPQYHQIRKELTAICWQNGLDFKEFLPTFIDIIIDEDWETSFEAFTVVENIESLPREEIIDQCKKKIKNSLPEVTDKKKYFLEEILVLIC